MNIIESIDSISRDSPDMYIMIHYKTLASFPGPIASELSILALRASPSYEEKINSFVGGAGPQDYIYTLKMWSLI